MFRVSLLTPVSRGVARLVGTIEFQGIPVEQVNGSVRVPVDDSGERVPFAYRCSPPGVISEKSVRRIAEDLSHRMMVGSVEDYDWHANDI